MRCPGRTRRQGHAKLVIRDKTLLYDALTSLNATSCPLNTCTPGLGVRCMATSTAQPVENNWHREGFEECGRS